MSLSLCPMIGCDMPSVPPGLFADDVVFSYEVTSEIELYPAAAMSFLFMKLGETY